LGHYIGLDLHDGPSLSTDIPLKPGMCFTIEPGLYFPDKKFGVRLEDDFTINEDGSLRRLGTGCAIQLNDIDSLRAGQLCEFTL
jgi:Xaa-Pro aminopeptidase